MRFARYAATRAAAVALSAAAALAFAAPIAVAHERRSDGPVSFVVGWTSEPAYAGYPNSVQVVLTDSAGQPIGDLGDTLKVEVQFGSEKLGPLTLEPAFGPSFGRLGEYHANVVPTRPGEYVFRFTGTVRGKPVDQTFTSGDKTFSPVEDSRQIQFPVKDPSVAELRARIDRSSTRVSGDAKSASSAANRAMLLGGSGLVLGAIALALTLAGRRKTI